MISLSTRAEIALSMLKPRGVVFLRGLFVKYNGHGEYLTGLDKVTNIIFIFGVENKEKPHVKMNCPSNTPLYKLLILLMATLP